VIKIEVKQIEGIECGLSPDEITDYFGKQIPERLEEWGLQLKDDPGNFGAVEKEVLQFGKVICGILTVAILADSEVQNLTEAAGKEIIKGTGMKWRHVNRIWRTVILLCGLTVSIYTPYLLPRKKSSQCGRPRGIGKRGKEGAGIYPEFAVLGIREGVTGPLQEEIARTTIFLPSFELSRRELNHRGIELDVKTVRRITLELGEQGLAARTAALESWKDGELPPGTAFHGKRVVVAIDGGRTRTRKKRPGRKTKKKRHRFETPWREPKLLVIYEVDNKGNRVAGSQQIVETGLQGPDQIAELTAFHLHRLGADKADVVVFLADGAEWIWDRVPLIVERAGLNNWMAAVDFCHAMGYAGRAVKAGIPNEKERKACVKKIRKALLTGNTDKTLNLLKALPDSATTEDIQTAIRYITRRRTLMQYNDLRAAGLPIGSGAVESAVRRVINLRLKNAGSFWNEDNAEAVMYLRANVLSGQWDNMLEQVKQHIRLTRKRDWKWNLTPYSVKADENQIYNLNQLLSEMQN